jgi:hypothetical protein
MPSQTKIMGDLAHIEKALELLCPTRVELSPYVLFGRFLGDKVNGCVRTLFVLNAPELALSGLLELS